MNLIVNDLSLHGQFNDIPSFQRSIERLMIIRQVAHRHLRTLYCHRNFANGRVTHTESLQQAINYLPQNQRRALMPWICQLGPYWDDERQHRSDDWYERDAQIVTDSAIAEAAHYCSRGIIRGLASIEPSIYNSQPLRVDHVLSSQNRSVIDVPNFWEPDALDAHLSQSPRALVSWDALRELSMSRFNNLVFSDECFSPLKGQPFKQGAAERILVLLGVLQTFRSSFDAKGNRTTEGHEIYQNFFTGEKSWFSDSSDTEKRQYQNELTFDHPAAQGEQLFCSWHGKIKTPQYRIHFSWPIIHTTPVYVVYVGPKITKR